MVRRRPDPGADTLPSPTPAPGEAGPVPAKPEGESFTAPRGAADEKPSPGVEGPVSSASCLQNDEILAYRAGETSEEQRVRIEEHLDGCERCRTLVHVLLQENSPHSTAAPRLALTFARGDLLAQRYKIIRFIAHGGMGEVYEALDTLGRKRVALKTVLCSSSDNPKAVHKLVEEVRNAQRVTHPHVCRINELHRHESTALDASAQYFLTMEFVEGEKLGTRLRREGLALPEALKLARQLLEGLRAAHRHDVLHLDFKSDNVILRAAQGALEAVIMDFGLSRALDTQSQIHTSERRQLAGSVYYMSPEQVQCSPDLGPAADVYSFGVVLFEMLTRQFPFDGDSPYAIMLQRVNKRPRSPSEFVSNLPPQLEGFVLKCLAREPHARWADAGEALAAFDRLHALDLSQPPPSRKRTVVAALTLTTLVVASFIYSRSLQRQPTQADNALHPAAPAASAASVVGSPSAPARAPASAEPAQPPAPPPSAGPTNSPQNGSAPAPAAPLGAPLAGARTTPQRGPSGGKVPAALRTDHAPSRPPATTLPAAHKTLETATPSEPARPAPAPLRPDLPGAPPGLR